MKKIFLLLSFLYHYQYSTAQQQLAIQDTIDLSADSFIGVDSFEALYYTKDNFFYKKWNQRSWQYGDFSLGILTSVSILNPLKIILYYASTNTVVILDKYLTEIDRINFNTISEFKNISSASAANDTNLWIFDTNTQQLELFDTNTDKTLISTQPITEIPMIQRSNFNYCWIATTDKLLQFNVYGSLLSEYKNSDFKDFRINNNHLIVLKEDALYRFSTITNKIEKLKLPEITVKQFYVANEILYIYHQSKIYSFDLTPQKK